MQYWESKDVKYGRSHLTEGRDPRSLRKVRNLKIKTRTHRLHKPSKTALSHSGKVPQFCCCAHTSRTEWCGNEAGGLRGGKFTNWQGRGAIILQGDSSDLKTSQASMATAYRRVCAHVCTHRLVYMCISFTVTEGGRNQWHPNSKQHPRIPKNSGADSSTVARIAPDKQAYRVRMGWSAQMKPDPSNGFVSRTQEPDGTLPWPKLQYEQQILWSYEK